MTGTLVFIAFASAASPQSRRRPTRLRSTTPPWEVRETKVEPLRGCARPTVRRSRLPDGAHPHEGSDQSNRPEHEPSGPCPPQGRSPLFVGLRSRSLHRARHTDNPMGYLAPKRGRQNAAGATPTPHDRNTAAASRAVSANEMATDFTRTTVRRPLAPRPILRAKPA